MTALPVKTVTTTHPTTGWLLERLARLDLSEVQHRFALGPGVALSQHVVNKISLEYRRFLLLQLVNPRREIPAPPLVDIYWRLHAADRSAFESDSAALTAGTVRRRLPFMFTKATHDRLLGEARERRDTVTEWHSTGYRTGRGTVASPCRTRSTNLGRVLHEVHWAGSASRLIAAETGAVVVPTTAAYLYFRSGDFIGIHTHDHGCELTLLTLLNGAVEPLHCHLHLVDVPLDEVRVLAEATGGLPEVARRSTSPPRRCCSPACASRTSTGRWIVPGRPSCWCSALRCSPGDWGRQGQAP